MGLIANPKVTIEMVLGTVGWSDSHYYNSVVNVNDPGLYNAAKALAAARASCLGGNIEISLVKMSQDTISRDVNYLKTADLPATSPAGNPPANSGYSGGPNYPGVTPSTTWLYQSPHLSWPIKLLDANNNQIAISYLAGMPQNAGQFGPGPLQGSGNTAGFYLAKYAQYLVDGPWGAASRTFPAGAFNLATSTPITAITYVPAAGTVPPQLQFAVVAAGATSTIAPGVWIRVGGMKYKIPQTKLRLNGSYQVVSYNAGVASVYVPRLNAVPVPFTAFGYMQCATYQLQDYVGYTLDPITHRKRGRVGITARGRRSA